MSRIDLDQAPVAPGGSLGGVPVIDLTGNHGTIVAAIAEACRDWGFFQIVGHGVSPGEINNKKRRELMRIEEQGNMLVLIEGRDHVLPEHVEFLCEDARGQTVPFPDGEHR